MEPRAPRVFGIPAAEAPVVGIVRRGPSAWCSVGRWDIAGGTYEPGAWLRGRLYPQRCDVSPDGAWLAYFALHAAAKWDLGWTYVAISQLPWLHALAAWGTAGTWTRGVHFVTDRSMREVDEPEHGTLPYRLLGAGLAVTRPASFAVERRRGWQETDESPSREPDDFWDERRTGSLRMTKPQPGSDGAVRLDVSGRYAAVRAGTNSEDVCYRVLDGRHPVELHDVQWCDWARDGRLLVATRAGRLEVRGAAGWLISDQTVADLADETPAPTAPPPTACAWPS
jgi:hypothetical protein